MPRLLLFIPLALFGVLILFLWKGLSLDPRELPSALIDKSFPAFKVESLLQLERKLTMADVIGKPVLVNVWATWCPSCRREHQELLSIAQENKIAIIGLNYKDNRAAATQWLSELGNPYQFNIYDESGMLGLDLGVYGAPETYLLDAQGIIRYRHVGAITEQAWQELQTIMQSWGNE